MGLARYLGQGKLHLNTNTMLFGYLMMWMHNTTLYAPYTTEIDEQFTYTMSEYYTRSAIWELLDGKSNITMLASSCCLAVDFYLLLIILYILLRFLLSYYALHQMLRLYRFIARFRTSVPRLYTRVVQWCWPWRNWVYLNFYQLGIFAFLGNILYAVHSDEMTPGTGRRITMQLFTICILTVLHVSQSMRKLVKINSSPQPTGVIEITEPDGGSRIYFYYTAP